MGEAIFTKNERLQQAQLKRQYVSAVVTLGGNTTPANITTSTDLTGGVIAYAETSGQPTPADSGANFGTLDSNAAPSTIGLLLMCGDALAISGLPRVTVISSASMTAGVATLVGTSSTGITASGNIAVVISCTALDLDATTANHTFRVEFWYDTK